MEADDTGIFGSLAEDPGTATITAAEEAGADALGG